MFSLSQHYYLGNYSHPWKLFLNLKYITKERLRHQTEKIRYKLTFQLVLLKKKSVSIHNKIFLTDFLTQTYKSFSGGG